MAWDWKKFEQLAIVVAPMALAAEGVDPALTNLIVHAVVVAQAAADPTADGTPKTGAEKKAIALAIVTDGLNAVNAAKPGTLDVAELTTVVSAGIDTTVAAIHAAQDIPLKPVVVTTPAA